MRDEGRYTNDTNNETPDAPHQVERPKQVRIVFALAVPSTGSVVKTGSVLSGWFALPGLLVDSGSSFASVTNWVVSEAFVASAALRYFLLFPGLLICHRDVPQG